MAKITFIEKDGTRTKVDAPLGLSIMEIAQKNNIEMEGACGGCLACATCHVSVEPDWYKKLDDISEDEEDMLDMAFDLTKSSRLCCQVIMTEDLDGIIVALPTAPRSW